MPEKYADKLADDEIDISAIVKKIVSAVSYPFFLLASNLKTTAFFLLLAVLAAYAAKYTIPKSYSSSFIIRPSDPKEKFHLKMLGDLEWLLRKKDYATLSDELKLSPAVARTIGGIDAVNSVSRPSRDSVNYTEITIHTTDYNQFLPIQKSLLTYLESNPYFAKIKTLQSHQVAMMLEQVNRDLPQLDSLKKLQISNYEKRQLSAQSPVLLNDLMNPTAVYAMSVDRMNKKEALMAQEVFSDNFQLIKSCVVVKNHSWPPRVLVMSLYNVPLFLLICILFLIVRDQLAKRRLKNAA